MNQDDQKYPFSSEDWQTCLKVLESLKGQPFENPDNEKFSGLITKIYKQAKKLNRQNSYHQKQEQNLHISQDTSISKHALLGRTIYSHLEQSQYYTKLALPKSCYCCQQKYTLIHSFYNRLCPKCAEINYKQRSLEADLTGRYAIVTGGRVKIGYATVLKLLRNGAHVVMTTRFPAIAMQQLQQEIDYSIWRDRCYVYGLDLRSLSAISTFVDFYYRHFKSLDILINNAAQTIRYPDAYYQSLVEQERQFLELEQNGAYLIANSVWTYDEALDTPNKTENQYLEPLTRFGQPIDTRSKNSWNSKLEEIALEELLEVNLINHIAPYILIKDLKPLFLVSQFSERFIINVTSSEGIFSYSNKTTDHPHTNMTKAALNMLTLTSAEEFAKDQIFMCAVDVGWVSTGVAETMRKKQFAKGYIPPLDPVDGASRIFHPIEKGIKGEYLYGVLLKNYTVHTW